MRRRPRRSTTIDRLARVFGVLSIGAAVVAPSSASLAQEDRDAALADACPQKVPDFVERMCHGDGVIDKLVLSLPEICRAAGKGDAIRKKLESCGQGSIYTDIWKLRYGLPTGFDASFPKFVADSQRIPPSEPGALIAAPVVLDMFNLTYLACGHDAACHKRVLGLLPADLQSYAKTTPVYCDFSEKSDLQFGAMYIDFLVDGSQKSGFKTPVCRQFYCRYRTCDPQTPTSDQNKPFTLSSVWDDYYAVTYEGRASQ